MSAVHDAMLAMGAGDVAIGWSEGATLELRVEAAAYPWPVAAPRRASLWERLTNALYKLVTPDLNRAWLDNFSYLDARLSRGAQPGREGFRALAELGVDTVINLRPEAPQEEALVRSLGMNYLFYPMDPMAAPSHTQVLAFLHTVCDPKHGHVFFHCYHGADRTGVVAACYRIAHDGWPLERALAELEDHRFHHAFQQAKLQYLRTFQRYWDGLPEAERRRVLHK
jgi:protein tyrosine/serine phosphatase